MVAAGNGADSDNARNRGVEIETVNVGELAELQPVGEDEVGVTI